MNDVKKCVKLAKYALKVGDHCEALRLADILLRESEHQRIWGNERRRKPSRAGYDEIMLAVREHHAIN